jgi:hypothetical protein
MPSLPGGFATGTAPYPEKGSEKGVGWKNDTNGYSTGFAASKDTSEKALPEGENDPKEDEEDPYEGLSWEVEYRKAQMCGETVIKYECGCGVIGFKPIKCGKWWCIECGNEYEYYIGEDGKRGHRVVRTGSIQAKREDSYYNRIDIRREHCHSFVFTLPNSWIKEIVATPNKWDEFNCKLHDLFVGNHKKGKNQIKGEYEGYKIIAQPHYHGDDLDKGFRPHVNIQVWFPIYKNGRERRWSVPASKLQRIKQRFKRLISPLFKIVEPVNVNVWNWTNRRAKRHGISYMVRPSDPKILDHVNHREKQFMLLYIKDKQHVRYWGLASNSHKAAWARPLGRRRSALRCPVCENIMTVAKAPDRQGVLRPVIMTRERLEMELEECGWNLIKHSWIWEAVKRQPEDNSSEVFISEEAAAAGYEPF